MQNTERGMQNENVGRIGLRSAFCILTSALLLLGIGCAETRWQQRQPTQEDPPFGGGFPSSHRPGGEDDPMDRNLRRTEIRPQWRGDNGAPETRVNTAGDTPTGGDSRLDTRTQ
jgi:hypothetical protein